jgi:hypothetical protein
MKNYRKRIRLSQEHVVRAWFVLMVVWLVVAGPVRAEIPIKFSDIMSGMYVGAT